MKRKTPVSMVIGLLATFGITGSSIGIVSTAEAGPKVSDGMANRFFQIEVKQLGVGGPPRANCYSFIDDGAWIDPLFLLPPDGPGVIPGEWWDEDSNGAITNYTARAEAFGGIIVLEQTGQVTPSFSNGTVRLTAFSTAYVFGEAVAEFLSTGYEVDSCDP